MAVEKNNNKPRAVILRTAGTNCAYETQYALEKAGADVDLIHVNQLVREKGLLRPYHIFILPGGFTYGDDIAAGKVLANQLRHHILDELTRFIDDGKLIIGICNGFQVLMKMGLLPGVKGTQTPLTGNKQRFTLTHNNSNKFEDRWVYLKSSSSKSVFIDNDSLMYVPIAHAEGKFVAENQEDIEKLDKTGQIVFKYVDKDGNMSDYPWNPNGSSGNVAGVCDSTGRVLGMMPHPERHIDPTQHPRWTREGLKAEGDGIAIFRNAVNYISRTFSS